MNKTKLKKIIIKELYATSLKALYEADDPAAPPADPAAAPADPAATPPVDPAMSTPAPDPAAPPAADPMAAPAPPADPMAGLGGLAPPADPAAPGAAPAMTGAPVKKVVKVKPPNPNEDPANFKIYSAMKKAISAAKNTANESLKRRSLKFLYEEDKKEDKEEAAGSSPDIDMDNFASSIANLIDNYTSLVDIKKAVIDQANYYLGQEFPDQAESLRKQLKNLLRLNYHISLERSEEPKDTYAVGAGSPSGGAA